MSTAFTGGERTWQARLGQLRDVVRQDLVARQLERELPAPPVRVIDLGCGQGTQALRLARRGYDVTGVDASADLLARFGRDLAAEPAGVRGRVRAEQSLIEDYAERAGAARFPVVLCHGVLMYLADPAPVLQAIAALTAPGGMVSLLVRNGDALAMRPGLSGEWAACRSAFGSDRYENRIGLSARADRLDDLTGRLAGHGLQVTAWYGVRVFTDTAPGDAEPPPDLAALLECEERAGRTDPYRRVAALLHVIARKGA
jgi:S-adenosylmethionine-dependent methyltransferase